MTFLQSLKNISEKFEKKQILTLGILVAVFILLYVIFYWLFYGRYIISTDNAYVRSEITIISSKVTGYVNDIHISDNKIINKDDLLIKIDDSDYKAKAEKAQADVDEAQATVHQNEQKILIQEYEIKKANALLQAAKAAFDRAKSDYERNVKLFKTHAYSESQLERVKMEYYQADAHFQEAEASLMLAQSNKKLIEIDSKKLQAMLASKQAHLKTALIDLNDTSIHAPINGTIGNRSVRIGQYVRAGSVLMQIVPLDKVWIVANLKETQITDIKVGNPVSIEVDAFSNITLTGKVDSISPASGAEFSLLPPDNATGNFTKIVQRIPVKITLNAEELKKVSLGAGMSAYIKINTKKVTS